MTTVLRIFAVLALAVHIQAARVHVQDASSIKADFECPSECLECCDSTGFFAKLGLSDRSFKCILPDASAMPDSECQDPSPRSSNYTLRGQLKTHCKYAASKIKAPPKCSERYTCCCTSDDHWEESQCFDGGLSIMQAKANHTGQKETFKMRDAQTFVNAGECRRPGNEHHPYDATSVPQERSRPQSTSTRSSGCCLKTRSETVHHHWTTTSLVRIGKVSSMRTNHHHEDKTYTVCMDHEKLHYCSDDQGVTSNGKSVYDAHSQPQEGICIGNAQSPIGKTLKGYWDCPESTFTGSWCQCQGRC